MENLSFDGADSGEYKNMVCKKAATGMTKKYR